MTHRYPEGTSFGEFFLAKESQYYSIKRMVNLPCGKRTAHRLPRNRYSQIENLKDLQDLVIRLNGRENRRSIQEIETKLAFLPTNLMEEFRALLLAEIPSQKDARLHYKNLHRYFLSFFVELMKLKDPIQWKSNETIWGMALLNELSLSDKKLQIFKPNIKKSVKTIKGIIHTANRFMAFLHKKMPQEISFIKFEPISKARFKAYNARLQLDAETVGKYINEKDWKTIQDNLPNNIAPFIHLGYSYGLRRSETLGFELPDISNGHLNIRRQLLKKGTYSPLKNRLKRKTPHWFTEPTLTYSWIQDSLNKKIHPDTLGVKFSELMKALGMDYELHDLRRTFITRALDTNSPKDVMLAVGHSSIEVTMKYIRDNRDLDDKVFIPG